MIIQKPLPIEFIFLLVQRIPLCYRLLQGCVVIYVVVNSFLLQFLIVLVDVLLDHSDLVIPGCVNVCTVLCVLLQQLISHFVLLNLFLLERLQLFRALRLYFVLPFPKLNHVDEAGSLCHALRLVVDHAGCVYRLTDLLGGHFSDEGGALPNVWA